MCGRLALPIQRGEHLPGSALPVEQALCRDLGVSRTILREAIEPRACFGIARHRADLSPGDLAQHEAVLHAILRRDAGSAELTTARLLQTSKAVQVAAVAPRP